MNYHSNYKENLFITGKPIINKTILPGNILLIEKFLFFWLFV